MDDNEIKRKIAEGVPMTIAHLDKNGNVTAEEFYNIENISLTEFQTRQLARAILDECEKFYSNPENVKRFEEWKAKKNK